MRQQLRRGPGLAPACPETCSGTRPPEDASRKAVTLIRGDLLPVESALGSSTVPAALAADLRTTRRDLTALDPRASFAHWVLARILDGLRSGRKQDA